MANVRGRHLADAAAFVAESFGPEGEAQIRAALDPETLRLFEKGPKPDRWYNLDVFVSYLRTARRVLCPEDESFYRRQGRFAGSRQKGSFLGTMATSPERLMVMAPTIWRMYYDVGRLVVVGDSPATAACQLHDFPTTPELCERFLGTWEGVASTPQRPARAEETRCLLRGDRFCQFHVS